LTGRRADERLLRVGSIAVLIIGIVALVVVVGGLLAVLVLARRQASEDKAPESMPSDFVAPVSSGGYRWRRTDETIEQFHDRVARENAAGEPPTKK
jgi:hypothetical protein